MLTISIAICTYNGAEYVSEQLESILNQGRSPDELVIVDDCSIDDTREIVQQFARTGRVPVRVYQNQENMGSTKNFEKAIGLCQGDLIVLSDQDDVWHPDKLKVIEDIFVADRRVGACFSDANIVDKELNSLGYRLWDAIDFTAAERERISGEGLFELLLKRNVVTGATMAFRREYVPHILPIPKEWVHDAWIAIILSVLTQTVAIDEPLIMYRQHGRNQIGALKTSVREKIKKARRSNAVYHTMGEYFEHARHRFHRLPGCEKAAFILEGKVEHARHRAKLPAKNKFVRVSDIACEVIKGRYHRYSNGWGSVVRDLLLV